MHLKGAEYYPQNLSKINFVSKGQQIVDLGSFWFYWDTSWFYRGPTAVGFHYFKIFLILTQHDSNWNKQIKKSPEIVGLLCTRAPYKWMLYFYLLIEKIPRLEWNNDRLREILILRSTYSVTRFLFFDSFRRTFCDLIQNEELRATFKIFDFLFKKQQSCVGVQGRTIRSIIVAVRARKCENFPSPIRLGRLHFFMLLMPSGKHSCIKLKYFPQIIQVVHCAKHGFFSTKSLLYLFWSKSYLQRSKQLEGTAMFM